MLQVVDMWQKSNTFRELLYHQPLLDIATSLIGANIQLFHDQALYKPAKIEGHVLFGTKTMATGVVNRLIWLVFGLP